MSGLAELLVRQGYGVSGSDLAARRHHPAAGGAGGARPSGPPGRKLRGRRRRGPLHRGQRGQPRTGRGPGPGAYRAAPGADAGPADGGPPQMAITGTHGKTSTTAMTAAVLRAGNLDPTVVVGSVWDCAGLQRRPGPGRIFRGRIRRIRRLLCLALRRRSASSPTWTKNTWISTGTWPTSRRCLPRIWSGCRKGARVIACADDPHLDRVLANCPQ